MAVHGALLGAAGAKAKAGYLVSVRGARLQVGRLDDIADDLRIDAICTTRGDSNILYEFTIDAAGQRLMSGRATVVLDAGTLENAHGRPS